MTTTASAATAVTTGPTNATETAPDSVIKDGAGLNVSVQSSQYFHKNKEGVALALQVGNYTLALHRGEDGVRTYKLYDESGKLVSPKSFPPYWVSGAELSQAAGSVNNSSWTRGICFGNRVNEYAHIDAVAEKLGISKENKDEFAKTIKARCNLTSNTLETEELNKLKNTILYTYDTEIRLVNGGRTLAFVGNNTASYYHLTDRHGRNIICDKWKLEKVENLDSLDPGALESEPFLRELRKSQNGMLLETAPYILDDENGQVNLISTKSNQVIFSDTSFGARIHPSKKEEIVYFNPLTSEVKTMNLAKANDESVPVSSRSVKLPGKATSFQIDPNGNFYIFVCHKCGGDAENRLVFVEAHSLKPIFEVPKISSLAGIDSGGSIIAISDDRQLVHINTNMKTFKRGGLEDAQLRQREELLVAARALQALKLPDLSQSQNQDAAIDMADPGALKVLQAKANQQLLPKIEEAKDSEQTSKVRNQIRALQQQEEFKLHPEIFDEALDSIEKREIAIKIASIDEGIQTLSKQIKKLADPEDILTVERRYRELIMQRGQVVIPEREKRQAVDAAINELSGGIATKLEKLQTKLDAGLSSQLEKIAHLADEAKTLGELLHLQSSREILDFETLVNLLPDQQQRSHWRGGLRSVVETRTSQIDTRLQSERLRETMRIAEQVENSREILGQIDLAITKDVHSVEELVRWQRNNPLITRFTASLIGTPDSIANREEAKLEAILKDAKKDLESRNQLQLPKNGTTVTFGKVTFPVYQDPGVVWKPTVVAQNETDQTGKLCFVDNFGRRFEASDIPVPLDLKSPATAQAIAEYAPKAEVYFAALKRSVPDFNQKWSINDHTLGYLDKISHISRIQLENQEGVLILEGDAGTGKNVLLDIFSHFTNRSPCTFSCNFQTEKEDLTYAFHFDAKKGTFSVDSKFIKALQTPGSIIVLDEINTLPPGVTKMLNPLLDYRRTLYLPDGRTIKADDSVIIYGTMNPQHYLGVKKLSQEVLTRSRVMHIDYPAEMTKGGKRSPFEAELLAKEYDCLNALGQADFYKAWNFVVNSELNSGGDKLLDAEMTKAVKNLEVIVRAANKVRSAYQAFHSGESTDTVEFVFSLREGKQIIAEVESGTEVRKAMKEVCLPKIAEVDEKRRVEILIDNA